MASGYTWSSKPSSNIYYATYERLVTNKTPSFECNNNSDLYTTKIGLITADEVIYAGGKFGEENNGYYLYIDKSYWTMSPYGVDTTADIVSELFSVEMDGDLSNGGVILIRYIRPVINISSNVTITGSGTISDPYIVQ